MLNIVVPMAGLGSRFIKAGYKVPKPFIDINGAPMIQRVVENLMPYEPHRFIFLARREHERYIKTQMSFAIDVIYVDEVTEGAACTVLLAKDLINNDDPLVIANSDQLVEWNDSKGGIALRRKWFSFWWKESNTLQDMINKASARELDGIIATFYASHPKWSYAKLGNDNLVTEVAEKKPISNHATVGIYYYRHGSDFVKYATRMMVHDIRVNGEFYVCPVFNQFIEVGRKIGIYPVRTMYGLGTPEDLQGYLNDLYL